jgi:hypothetical protein
MPELKKRVRSWGYVEAERSVVYVRCLLGSLRAAFVAALHSYRLAARDPDNPVHREAVLRHRQEGIAVLEELDRLGVIPYQSPLRGIALFAFEVGGEQLDGSTETRTAYLVYKDSREAIDSFVFAADLYDQELLAVERPVPESWKAERTGRLLLPLKEARP